jgi:hypothetical protein
LAKAYAGWPIPGLEDVTVPVPGVVVACAELSVPGAYGLVRKLLAKEAASLAAQAVRYAATA